MESEPALSVEPESAFIVEPESEIAASRPESPLVEPCSGA
jgi:hypothetical protein